MSTVTTSRLAETAAPLDVLLVDAALGPLRRFVPDMSTAKWALSLARKPDHRPAARRAGRRGRPSSAARRRSRRVAATAGSRMSRGPTTRCSSGWSSSTSPAARPPSSWSPTPTSTCATAGACVPRREPRRGARAEQRPARQPGVGQGRHRHRRPEPGAGRHAAGQGPGVGTAGAADGRSERLRPRREHRRHAGGGRVPQRGAGAHPVRTADRRGLRGAAAAGPADDQQVLRDRPGAGAQPDGVQRPPGPADVRHLVAQPRRPARGVELRHLRARDPRRPRRGRGDHRQRPDRARRDLLRRHPREHHGGVPRRDRPPGPAGRAVPRRHRHRQPRGRHAVRAVATRGWRPWPRRSRPARGSSTDGRWPRSSPGCGRAT